MIDQLFNIQSNAVKVLAVRILPICPVDGVPLPCKILVQSDPPNNVGFTYRQKVQLLLIGSRENVNLFANKM